MWCPEDKLMDDYSHILFNKTPQQLRLIGARGGKAFGRNQRAHRALLPPPAATVPPPAPRCQTTAEDIAVLDARFPWLRGAEKRQGTRRRTPDCMAEKRAA
jgi:hypothetical protein